MNRVVPIFALAAFPLALAAQWPDYPTPSVPKTPAGKPNLDGPTPRTADGHPDLSGVWENKFGNITAQAQSAFDSLNGPPKSAPPPDAPK